MKQFQRRKKYLISWGLIIINLYMSFISVTELVYAKEITDTKLEEGFLLKESNFFLEEEQVEQMKNETSSQLAELTIEAPSAILMEASTGRIVYEKNADEQRNLASVTKIMTILLIFEALESGKLSLEDKVTVSEHAASMGGSQVFLEAGETQTVKDMLKCIIIASGNDASVSYKYSRQKNVICIYKNKRFCL